MAEYINVESLAEFARNHVGGMIDVNDIERFPRADVEVVKYGHWIMQSRQGSAFAICSNCGREALGSVDVCDNCKPVLSPCCPYCFSKMNGKDI